MVLVKFIIDAILIEVEHFIIKIFGQRSKGILPNTVQTNLSNMETEGTEQIVRIREVSVVWRSWILCHFKDSIDGIKCSLSQNWPKQVYEVHFILLTENKWYCYRMNNKTIDYTLIRNDKQEIVLNKNCDYWSVRNKEVKFVWIFSLGPRFRVHCPYCRGFIRWRLLLQRM